ncbi:MAG: hypothetical protein HQM08_03110 [Candidatus Riflebacteria bacterium]|nr:hypothetical protein [Candidatus Riflebacteria bacterium]
MKNFLGSQLKNDNSKSYRISILKKIRVSTDPKKGVGDFLAFENQPTKRSKSEFNEIGNLPIFSILNQFSLPIPMIETKLLKSFFSRQFPSSYGRGFNSDTFIEENEKSHPSRLYFRIIIENVGFKTKLIEEHLEMSQKWLQRLCYYKVQSFDDYNSEFNLEQYYPFLGKSFSFKNFSPEVLRKYEIVDFSDFQNCISSLKLFGIEEKLQICFKRFRRIEREEIREEKKIRISMAIPFYLPLKHFFPKANNFAVSKMDSCFGGNFLQFGNKPIALSNKNLILMVSASKVKLTKFSLLESPLLKIWEGFKNKSPGIPAIEVQKVKKKVFKIKLPSFKVLFHFKHSIQNDSDPRIIKRFFHKLNFRKILVPFYLKIGSFSLFLSEKICRPSFGDMFHPRKLNSIFPEMNFSSRFKKELVFSSLGINFNKNLSFLFFEISEEEPICRRILLERKKQTLSICATSQVFFDFKRRRFISFDSLVWNKKTKKKKKNLLTIQEKGFSRSAKENFKEVILPFIRRLLFKGHHALASFFSRKNIGRAPFVPFQRYCFSKTSSKFFASEKVFFPTFHVEIEKSFADSPKKYEKFGFSKPMGARKILLNFVSKTNSKIRHLASFHQYFRPQVLKEKLIIVFPKAKTDADVFFHENPGFLSFEIISTQEGISDSKFEMEITQPRNVCENETFQIKTILKTWQNVSFELAIDATLKEPNFPYFKFFEIGKRSLKLVKSLLFQKNLPVFNNWSIPRNSFPPSFFFMKVEGIPPFSKFLTSPEGGIFLGMPAIIEMRECSGAPQLQAIQIFKLIFSRKKIPFEKNQEIGKFFVPIFGELKKEFSLKQSFLINSDDEFKIKTRFERLFPKFESSEGELGTSKLKDYKEQLVVALAQARRLYSKIKGGENEK